MIFLSTLIALGLLLGWKVGKTLQRDTWFFTWLTRLHEWGLVTKEPVVALFFAVGVPGVLLTLVICFISYYFSGFWLILLYVPVLIYSLGRGNLTDDVNHYLAVSARGDTVAAARWVDELQGAIGTEAVDAEVDDWQKLHAQALEIISYRNFERVFGVLFWFFVLGAVGALIYRLSVLYAEHLSEENPNHCVARRWLWILEWPGVRVLGLSWALVGNFDSCYGVWRRDLTNRALASKGFLSRSLRGALGMTPVTDTTAPIATTEPTTETLTAPVINGITTELDNFGLINASLPLFSRALLLWLSVLAIVSLTI